MTRFSHPRKIADKSIDDNLQEAIKMTLAIESKAVCKNTQSFNKNRYVATGNIHDYNTLKNKVRKIKENAIENLPRLLNILENSVIKNGGHFYIAKSGEEAGNYIKDICKKHRAKLVVKAKSITSEEIKLNNALEKAGIEVAETDLAEFILQVSGEQPSHIVAPAIHKSRERISELFKEKFKTDLPLESGEDLTKFARDILRQKFLSADIGITGANLIAADNGTLLLVESEGNIRMVTQAPSVHIAIAGIEKIVPSVENIWPFIELLAPSATGQNLTSYTHIITPPIGIPSFSFDGRSKKKREFYLVLVDNGRMAMRDDPIFRETLYCIRCSACMNVCSNFQAVGGHAFGGETYSGGIGGSWEAGIGKIEKAKFSELCTGCARCTTACPVKINIPWLNENLQNRLNNLKINHSIFFVYKGFFHSVLQKKKTILQKQFFANYYFFVRLGSKAPLIFNKIAKVKLLRILLEKTIQVDKRRIFPKLKGYTIQKHNNDLNMEISSPKIKTKVLLYADSFTNFFRPDAGIATLKIFKMIGTDISVSKTKNEGRDSLSQGFLEKTKNRADKTGKYILGFIKNGYDIIVTEPSVLTLFNKDYKHFICEKDFKKIKAKCYEPFDYLAKIIPEYNLDLTEYFDLKLIRAHPPVFYHSHCQQRSIEAEISTVKILKKIGFKVICSTSECCGMAGSFGYKKHFYDISKRVGEDLTTQIKNYKKRFVDGVILTSGVSCHEQITALMHISTLHPMAFLVNFLNI